MKGMRNIPKILRINRLEGFLVSCLFSNGQSRLIDFSQFFENHNVLKVFSKFPELKRIEEFSKIEIIGNSIGWKQFGVEMEDFKGVSKFYPYELDPLVLFNVSFIDEKASLGVGKLIRKARMKQGLSQAELAQRSGTTRHYISKIENDRSDIELLTLKKIVEAGLGKEIDIKIQ